MQCVCTVLNKMGCEAINRYYTGAKTQKSTVSEYSSPREPPNPTRESQKFQSREPAVCRWEPLEGGSRFSVLLMAPTHGNISTNHHGVC